MMNKFKNFIVGSLVIASVITAFCVVVILVASIPVGLFFILSEGLGVNPVASLLITLVFFLFLAIYQEVSDLGKKIRDKR